MAAIDMQICKQTLQDYIPNDNQLPVKFMFMIRFVDYTDLLWWNNKIN